MREQEAEEDSNLTQGAQEESTQEEGTQTQGGETTHQKASRGQETADDTQEATND